MNSLAVILEMPERLALRRLAITSPGAADAVIEIEWSGISTGTEKLLWSGRMPHFPGMGYPLVPGYESVGRVVSAGPSSGRRIGERVFVPGATCYGEVKGLFGGAASRIVAPGARVSPIDESLGERAILLALAATALHAIAKPGSPLPDLIVGHGVLGRLMARLVIASGGRAPVVWETAPDRRTGAVGYDAIDPADDDTRTYRSICDVSGDGRLLDSLVARLAPGGEIVLAGFYDKPLSFSFPPAFMREAKFRVAAQWQPSDLEAIKALVQSNRLSLDDLITHRSPAAGAEAAYRTAFDDSACLKMVLDWSACS